MTKPIAPYRQQWEENFPPVILQAPLGNAKKHASYENAKSGAEAISVNRIPLAYAIFLLACQPNHKATETNAFTTHKISNSKPRYSPLGV